MNERIKAVRKNLNLTAEQFGKRLGVGRTAISNIENGNRKVTEQMFKSVCREFGVSENWLRTGEGDMYEKKSRNELAADIVKKTLDTDDEFILNTFIALGKLSPDEWNIVKKFVDKIKNNEISTSTPAPAESVAELEESYKKSRSNSARKKGSSALNMSGDIENESKLG